MRRLALALALFAALSCSTTSERAIQEDVRKGDYEAAQKKIEENTAADPDGFGTHIQAGENYYLMARKAIDDDKQQEYAQYFRKAQAEFLAAARLEPDSPEPHTWLGIITAYEGDMNGAELAFRNALRLATMDQYERPSGFYYSNLAHIAVYRGELPKARRYLTKAQKYGASADEIARISILASWKANDMVEARDIFNGEAILSKQFAETWDGAPLPKKMESFDDFAAACCKNPTCGPHMEHACARERQAVARRQLDAETAKAQLEAERERRAKLKEIYQKTQQNRSLDVQVETEPNSPPPSGDAQPAPKAPDSTQVPARTPAKSPAPAKTSP